MNKTLIILLAGLVLTAGSVLASRVTNVEVKYEDGMALAQIDVEGTVRFSHQTEIAKDGKPFRVIVDILSATHNLGAKNFWALPKCPIKGLRTSQYSVKPEKVVRLVFDLYQQSVYQVTSDDKSVTISIPYSKGKAFASWTTTNVVAQLATSRQKDKTTVASKPAPAVKPSAVDKSAIQMNAAIDHDRMASLESTQTSTKAAPATKAKQTAVVTPKVTKPDTIALDIPARPETGDLVDPAPRVPGPFVSNPAPVKTAPVKPKATTEKTTVAKVTPEKKITVTKAVPAKPTTANVTAKVPATPKVAASSIAKTKKSAKPPVVVAKADEPKKTKAISPKNAKVDDKKKPQTTVARTAAKPTTPETVAETSKKKPTSRFRRSPTRPTKIKGTLVAEFPKRLVIKYKSRGRDPFETLINATRTSDSPIGQRVPNVEGLRLVGVIESGGKPNSALFEDNDGYGYILKEGDKVRKGYVLRVDQDQVHFQIFEYGWSRTLSLSLDEY
ncbi:MAG: hypothetical protein KOO62_09890 [candidate division Zixibacteria bacterium]|nr:hypothetical protein [candidate division Zixibacteria bacterium]